MFARFASCLLVVVCCATALGQAAENPAAKELAARIERLIKQLGAEEFVDREAATKGLMEIGNLARGALEKAARSPDPETASRASGLLERLPKLTHTVVDALGAPLPLAKMAVRMIKKEATAKLPMDAALPPPVTVLTDESGRVAIPELPAADFVALATVEHADYGQAQCEIGSADKATTIQLPLVRQGTEEHRRALRGLVVDSAGKPVARAMIHCDNVRTPGEGLINGVYPRGDSLTDEEGRFTCYLPNENRNRERGELIPENSRYFVRISVPQDDTLFPIAGYFANAAPVRIELLQATKFFRFRFESAFGGMVEDPELLRNIQIQFERMQDGARILVPLDQAAAAKGGKLPEGKYLAESFGNKGRTQYEPLVVSADSPDELIFRLPPATTYRGRAMHGVTREPVKNAFVMGFRSTARNNLALLSAEEWEALRALDSNPPQDDPALRPLEKLYGVQGLVRSDAEGRFQFTRQGNQEVYGLIAFAEDFLPFQVRLGSLKADAKNQVELGDIPLFPAAKLLVRPVFEGPRLSVSPAWALSERGQPDWIEQFRAATKNSDRLFEYVHWLTLNELQPVYVPAGLQLKLRFESPYDDKWAPAVIQEPVQLKQGATHEVGDVRFAPCLPAVVRVVNKDGVAVEGLPVRRLHTAENSWCVAHNTDKDGQAFFHLHPNSRGKFRVSDLPGPQDVGNAPNLFAEFTVQDKAPAEPFTITVTDEQIQLLRGVKK